VTFSPDGKQLAARDGERLVKIWYVGDEPPAAVLAKPGRGR
jgi:hypothetical protein